MSQVALFHESITDAMREVILALGGLKSVASRMRPEMPADHAGRWLADCLSAERREKLSPDGVLWLGREGRAVGCHALANFFCRDLGYADPVPLEPDDEKARLEREFIEAAKSMQAMAERLTRLGLKVA